MSFLANFFQAFDGRKGDGLGGELCRKTFLDVPYGFEYVCCVYLISYWADHPDDGLKIC